MWPDWISVLERSLWLLGWTWCVGCNVYVDGVGLARREEGRLARRLYQWLKQEKMVACAGWRGEPKFRVATWWATYSYTVVIRYCSSLKKNCSKKEVGKFPDINAWLMTTIFNVFVSVGQSLIPLEPFSFIPILLPAGGTEGRHQHCSLLFSVIQLIVISICWEMRMEERVWGKEVRRNVRRVGLWGSDQSLASWICSLNTHPLVAVLKDA